MATQTVLDLPAITYVEAGDVAYLVRGVGAGRDKQLNVEDGLIPTLLTFTGTDSVNLSLYGGDLTIYASGSITLTFSGALRDGKQLVVMNKGTGSITCAGTVTASLRQFESLNGVSDSSAMHVTRYVSNDASGNILAYGNIAGSGNITATGTASIDGAIKSGTTGTNGSIQIARTSDGATLGTFTTDGTDISLGSATGKLALQTAGTDRLTIDASGNVGVGVGVIPSQLFEIGKNTDGGTNLVVTNTSNGTSSYCGLVMESDVGNCILRTHSAAYTANGWGGTTLLGTTLSTNGLILYSALERIRFQGAGAATRMELNDNVLGLGSYAPATWSSAYNALEIGGNAAVMANTTRAGSTELRLMHNTYYDGAYKRISTDEASAYRQSSGIHRWYSDIQNTAGVGFTPTKKMELTLAGQLLIGTDVAPSLAFPLVVATATGTGAYASFQTSASGTGSNGSYVGHSDTDGLRLWGYENLGITFGTNSLERMTISAAGVLTLTNGAVFNSTVDINGALTTKAITLDAGSNLIVGTGTSTFGGVATFNGAVDINAALTTRGITVDSSYNLTVTAGITTLGGTLDLNGQFVNNNAEAGTYTAHIENFSTTAGSTGLVVESASGSTILDVLQVKSSPGTMFRVNGAGQVFAPLIYTSTVSSSRDVEVQADGELGYVLSARRTKTNIDYNVDSSWIHDLKVVEFEYKKRTVDHNEPEGYKLLEEGDGIWQPGLIAEDVAEVNPDMVIYDDDVIMSVHYKKLIPLLLNEVQEQRKSIDTLSAVVTALEARLDKLEGDA